MVKILAVTSLLILGPTADGLAQWQPDGIPVCTATGGQSELASAYDNAGGVIVVWRDFRSGSTADLYAQRVDAYGTPLWAPDGVPVCTATGSQQNLGIAPDGSGGVIVAWEDWRGFNPDIYAQRIDASGNALWTPDGVPVCTVFRAQTVAVVTPDGSGGAIIAWDDKRLNNSTDDIYMQRIDASGAPVWTLDGVPVCAAASSQFVMDIAGDGAHGAIAVWLGSGANNVWAQRIDASGAPVWTLDGVAICSASGTELNPQLVADASGGAVFAWQDNRPGGATYLQRVDGAGNAQWAADGIPACATPGGYFQSMIPDGSDGVIIAWSDDRFTATEDIYAQRVDASGNKLWGAEGEPVCTAASDQSAPRLAPDGAGGAILVWADYRSGANCDVYAQRIDANGADLLAPNGVEVCTATADQRGGVTATSTGRAIAAWADLRDGTSHVYAMEVGEPATAAGGDAPAAFSLGVNRPNPFGDGTFFDLELSSEASVEVDVFDVAGRRVNGRRYAPMTAGTHSLHVTALDGEGRPLPSGVYFCRVRAGGSTLTRKMVIAR
jgi:hypothetical protein